MMRLTLEGEPDSDQDELDELTVQLRAVLLDTDVDDVELVRSQDVPTGAKPGEVVAVGALAVALTPIALRGALQLVETWLATRPVRKVRIVLGDDTLELEQASPEQQQRLVETFVAAHRPAADAESGATSGAPAA
jgi:hypothetical protein